MFLRRLVPDLKPLDDRHAKRHPALHPAGCLRLGYLLRGEFAFSRTDFCIKSLWILALLVRLFFLCGGNLLFAPPEEGENAAADE